MKRVLVAPLDWGLGHATRCIPVIRALLNRQAEVCIAGSGDSLKLLKVEFPSLKTFLLPGYQPRYPGRGVSMVVRMAFQLPHFLRVIRAEHSTMEEIVREQKIDIVISDNRYGCWSASVPSVFITHQSNILMPKRFGWLAPLVRRLNHRMMNRFSQCWIPDVTGEKSLAGELIGFDYTDKKFSVRHIGWLSRFEWRNGVEKKYDLLCVFSGPEPQRSLLEEIVVKQLEQLPEIKVMIVRGLPDNVSTLKVRPTVEVCNFLGSEELQLAIASAQVVLARSGFSTVMDLSVLGSKAIFIPTPGQTEQEYLAERIFEKNVAYFAEQRNFDLAQALKKSNLFTGFLHNKTDEDLLASAVDTIMAD